MIELVDWLYEVKAEGDVLNRKIEAIKKWRESLPQHILDHLDAIFLRLDPKFSLLDALHEILEAS